MFFIDSYRQKVKECADKPIITERDGERTLSYQEFDQISNRIAGLLVNKGIKKGDHVIILLSRCSEYIAAEIALLKLGAVIIPLIPEYPKERIDYIRKDSGAVLVIDQLFLDELYGDLGDSEFVPKVEDADGDERAMIVYTSGSTGNPKGVVYNRNHIDAEVIRKCECVKNVKPLVFAASATMSFCVVITEYHRTISLGGHVHMISDEVRSDAEKLADYYAAHQITAGFISPRILRNFKSKSSSLQRVFTASEKIVNIYSEQFDIVNCYGQSETVGSIAEFLIDRFYDNTPIGKPVKGIDIIISDAEGNKAADGEEGQICIIGDIPYEYNNLPEQTAKTFRRLPDGRTFTYTGDIGKILPDGNLLYLNRNDWMLKIHGQRVEPGEIEAVMNKVEGITASIVKAFDNEDGTMLVCGFYTESKPVDKNEIKEMLEKHLPHYMIPGTFVKMDAFPVNPNGKIDRKSIGRPDLNSLKTAYEKPENEIEEALCLAMEKILQIDRIGRNDNFMELGGNSLNAVMLCAESGIKGIAPQIVIIGQTPAAIAKMIMEKQFSEKPEIQISGTIRETYPLSFAQRYQYDVCSSYNTPIDTIDMQYYFLLDEEVDLNKLKQAVADVVNEHPIYKSHIDIENNLLITDDEVFSVKETTLSEEEFAKYRDHYYRRVRDYRKDPLVQAEIIKTNDEKVYLFLCLCHLIYDGKTLKNFVSAIEENYNDETKTPEQATIFDLIDYEEKLKADTELTKKAMEVFEENYKDLKPTELFDGKEKYDTGFSKRILEGISQEEIDVCLKKYGISVLTLFEGAMEMTVEKIFDVNDFCYMNVYDGRTNHLLNDAHGVFAKAVFVRSSDKSGSLKEVFEQIENQYQKLVYFDVVNTFDIVRKYPAIRSGITFNYRDLLPLFLRLGEKRYGMEFIYEFYEVNKPYTDFDCLVNKLPLGYGYNMTISSAKINVELAEKFATEFDETVKAIIKAEI